jgi:hypothetical protein
MEDSVWSATSLTLAPETYTRRTVSATSARRDYATSGSTLAFELVLERPHLALPLACSGGPEPGGAPPAGRVNGSGFHRTCPHIGGVEPNVVMYEHTIADRLEPQFA